MTALARSATDLPFKLTIPDSVPNTSQRAGVVAITENAATMADMPDLSLANNTSPV